MRSILEIITFFTPLDERKSAEEKEAAIEDMVQTSMENSWENFKVTSWDTWSYSLHFYTIDSLRVELSVKKDEYMSDFYAPHMILTIGIDEIHFKKENIEAFLNTVTRFFSGVYKESYFISYDSKYSIIEMNSGKKYSIEDIKDVDLQSIFSEKNKNLLDSLLYLHYTLEERIKDFTSLEKDLNPLSTQRGVLESALFTTWIRKGEVQESLIKNRSVLHAQIEIILQYFS